jgi:hypothetical protein
MLTYYFASAARQESVIARRRYRSITGIFTDDV